MKKNLANDGFASVSLTLNVPGFPKNNKVVNAFFRLILTDLKFYLTARRIQIDYGKETIISVPAGDFFLAPVVENHLDLAGFKNICEEFEESHPLGRFIDVDLTDSDAKPVSSGKQKLCFYCGTKPAVECRRGNVHQTEELRLFMFSKMKGFCQERRQKMIAKKLSAQALNAMLTEISLTPKPGLVDRFNNGSHTDMDYLSFLGSSATISTWFEELAGAGFHFNKKQLEKALPVIREIGLRMEHAMFETTKGVNTQKGLIFLMGLSIFAFAMIFKKADRFDFEDFRSVVKSICKNLVGNELAINPDLAKSHGEQMFSKYRATGARGEAESGFQTIFDFGMTWLTAAPEITDEELQKCFLGIASHNVDTNMLYRGGQGVLSQFQELCKKTLHDFNPENYSALIDFCKNKNVSPGGSADLLAVAIFIHQVFTEVERQFFYTILE